MSWVTDRFRDLAPVHGHQTGHVLVAEVLGEILSYMKQSDREDRETLNKVLPAPAPTKPTDITIPVNPVNVTVPVQAAVTADGTTFRFNHADLQKLSDKTK